MQETIQRHIDRAIGVPIVWGENDCCLFVADIIEEATGIDPAEPWRETYSDQAEANAAMPDGLVKTLDRRFKALGWPRIPVETAKTGDIGIARNLDTPAAVVVRYGDWWVGRAEYGVTYVPSEQVIVAWSVPWSN